MTPSTRTGSVCLLVLALAACAPAAGSSGDDASSATPTPGGTPTPTPVPGTLGCRPFAISSGADGSGAAASAYYASALGSSTDVSEFLGAGGWNAPSSLSLCAGDPSTGKAPVTLAEDVTVAVSLPQSNCLCRRYVSASATGTLWCSASSDPLGVTVTLDSHGTSAGSPPAESDGAGTAGIGDLVLSLQVKEADVSGTCTPDACATALASAPSRMTWYTTGTATSQVTNARQGGTVTISTGGKSFGDCGGWTSAATKGSLAGAPEQSEDDPQAGNDVATVERIAESP